MRHVMPREGLNPETCVKDTGTGTDRECLWDSDCDSGAICQGRSCHHNIEFMSRALGRSRGEGGAKALSDNSTDENFKALMQFEHAQFSYFLNIGIFIPWGLLAIPLGIISFRLCEVENEKDKIYTAEDENLRHTEICTIGISGVALLRRPSDRRWAIRCAFVSLLLQVAFLYFIVVYDFAFLLTEKHAVFIRTPVLLFCGVLVNALSCCSIMISGSKMWHTAAPEGYQDIHRILVALDSFIIPSVCIVAGTLYLCTSNGIMSLVFGSTALQFVVSFNARFAGLLSWSLSVHGGRAFKPTEILIKDDVDSMTYAYRSLIFSFTWALLTVIVGSTLVGVLEA